MGTAQCPLDLGVSLQVGSTGNFVNVHLGTFRIAFLRITKTIGLCHSMGLREMALEKMLVTVGLATPFARADEIAFVEVRDVVMRGEGLFRFEVFRASFKVTNPNPSMISTPLPLRRRFVIVSRSLPVIEAAIQFPSLVDLQMRLEAFLLAECLTMTIRIWARRRMRRPHMRLKIRPS